MVDYSSRAGRHCDRDLCLPAYRRPREFPLDPVLYEGERIGNLHITLDKVNINFDADDRNVWNLVLNKEITQDLNIKFGAGNADLDLSGFNLENFEFTTGAGDYYINLWIKCPQTT